MHALDHAGNARRVGGRVGGCFAKLDDDDNHNHNENCLARKAIDRDFVLWSIYSNAARTHPHRRNGPPGMQENGVSILRMIGLCVLANRLPLVQRPTLSVANSDGTG